MADPSITPTHPLLVCAERVLGAVDEARGCNPALMDTRQKERVLLRLVQAKEELRALELHLLSVSDDVAEQTGARDAAAWLSHQRHGRPEADRRALALGRALEHRWHRVADAFAGGAVNEEQAQVIVEALDAVPASLGSELAEKAETHLVELAAHHGPAELKRLGRHILDVVAPEIADEEDKRRLEAEEQAARRRTSLQFRTRSDGTADISIRVPQHVADRLKVYLESYTAPRHRDAAPLTETSPEGEVERLPHRRRLGEAFCALLERMPSRLLPRHGGTATTVVVTVDKDDLISGLGRATLASGHDISINEARRLACNAGLMPAVLDGDSVPLDLGRKQRLYEDAQRVAMILRDQRCRADGCDIPAAWCEGHHKLPWGHLGRTDLKDGVLLCPWHHHRAHDDRYATAYLANGDVRFNRRRT